jgi:hypothetical protein
MERPNRVDGKGYKPAFTTIVHAANRGEISWTQQWGPQVLCY